MGCSDDTKRKPFFVSGTIEGKISEKIMKEKLDQNSSSNKFNNTKIDDDEDEENSKNKEKKEDENKEEEKKEDKNKVEEIKEEEENKEKEKKEVIFKSSDKHYTIDPNLESSQAIEPENKDSPPGVVEQESSELNKDKKSNNFDKKSNQNLQNEEIDETPVYNFIDKEKIEEVNKDDIEVKKNNDDNNNNYNNYNKFEENKEYYLICPDCDKNIIKIESIIYDSDKKDFIITYKCFCDKNCQKLLYQIISDDPSYCDDHRNKLNFLCEKCNKLLCEECLEEHKEHKIKDIINEEVISEELIEKINENKDEFKGYNIIQKIIAFYKSDKNNEIINNHNKRPKFIAKPDTGKSFVIKESQENLNIEQPQNFNNNNISINNMNAITNNENNINNSNEGEEERNIEEKNLSLIKYKNIKTINAHESRISALIELNNGFIASGSYDGTVKIWDISKEEEEPLIMKKIALGAVFCFLEFEPGKLLGGTSQNTIDLWDLNDKSYDSFIFNFYRHYLWVNSLVKLDENHFASASNDTRIIIWDYKNRKLENVLGGHSDCIMAMIKLKNGYLCTAGHEENIIIWDWKNLRSLFSFRPHGNFVKCLLELNNGYLLTGSEDNTIGIWEKNDLEQYNNIVYLQEHKLPVRALCQINEKYFASGSFDKTIKIWDFEKKECVQTLEGHQDNIICIIKIKNNMLISCSNDRTIKIWDAN